MENKLKQTEYFDKIVDSLDYELTKHQLKELERAKRLSLLLPTLVFGCILVLMVWLGATSGWFGGTSQKNGDYQRLSYVGFTGHE